MQFVTSFERRGRREGREQGRQEAYCASILSFLQARFDAVPAELQARVAGIQKPEKLAQLVTLAGTVDSLEQFGLECG